MNEVLLLLVGIAAIVLVFRRMKADRQRKLSSRMTMLLFSVMTVCYVALWTIVYGPEMWVIIQAAVLVALFTLVGFLSDDKST